MVNKREYQYIREKYLNLYTSNANDAHYFVVAIQAVECYQKTSQKTYQYTGCGMYAKRVVKYIDEDTYQKTQKEYPKPV